MNRSARISAEAKTGQVWCSEAAWQQALAAGINTAQTAAASAAAAGALPSTGSTNQEAPGSAHQLMADLTTSKHTASAATPADRASSPGISACEDEPAQAAVDEVVGIALGSFKLKGIAEEMGLVEVRFANETVMQ
jgi:hypothetical protein